MSTPGIEPTTYPTKVEVPVFWAKSWVYAQEHLPQNEVGNREEARDGATVTKDISELAEEEYGSDGSSMGSTPGNWRAPEPVGEEWDIVP